MPISRTKPEATSTVSEVQTAVTPTGAGDIQQTGDNLIWWGQSAAATQTAERTVNKDAASGYAGLDGSSELSQANCVITAAIKDNNVTSAKIAGAVRKVTTASLSAANIIAMNGAPVELIAAPGATKAIIVENVVFEMTRTATAFTGGGAVSITYDGETDNLVATIADSVVTGAAGTTISTRVLANISDIAIADVTNKAVDITNASAAFADGTGTAEVHIAYRVVDLTA